MKKILIFVLILTLCFTLLALGGEEECIVICSSAEAYRNDALQEQLGMRFPDKNIVVMYMPTGKLASKVYAEGSTCQVDILLGLETGYLSKLESQLENLSKFETLPYMDGLDLHSNGDKWVTWERQAGAIIVNETVLAKHGLPIPHTYSDLLNPCYKGLIAMPDPKSSGTGFFFYKSWVNTMGEDAALAYVDQLRSNLKQFTESGSGPIKLLKQGEVAIGLALTFQAVSEINAGQPFRIIFPETGSPYSLTGTALLKGKSQDPEVCEVFDYIIHDFLSYDKEYFSPEPIYHGQKNRIENYPSQIPYADMDGIQSREEKERLLALWKY